MGGVVVDKRRRRPVDFYGIDSPMSYKSRNGSIWTAGSVEVFGTGHQWDATPTQQTTGYRSRGEDLDGLTFGLDKTELSFREIRSDSNDRKANRHGDFGHPFDTIERRLEVSHPQCRFQSADGTAEYVGPVVPDPAYFLSVGGSNGYVDIPPSTDLDQWGTKGIAQTIPTNPLVDVTTMLGEIVLGARHEGWRNAILSAGGANPDQLARKTRAPGGVVRQKHDDEDPLLINVKKRNRRVTAVHYQGAADRKRAKGLRIARDAADKIFYDTAKQHLESSFGVGATLRDLSSVFQTTMDAAWRLDNLRNMSGVEIHRRRRLLETTEVLGVRTVNAELYNPPNNSTITPKLWPSKPDGSSGLRGVLKERIVKTTKVWFVGSYVFHLPQDHPIWGKLGSYLAEARMLYGIRLDLDVLWELTPWSWMSDWFLNVGDFIHNVSAFQNDALVLKYGYVMKMTTITRSVDFSGHSVRPGCPPFVSANYVTIRKERAKATPYGFGRNPAAFTERQWGILSALGLTKAWKILF